MALFFTFEWLSPQIYNTYYISLLGVPWQIVIQIPPTPQALAKLLSFSDNAHGIDEAVFGQWHIGSISNARPE